jgi:hypothetical protein
MTPVTLAFWAMDDGSSTPEGYSFNTMSFTYNEQFIIKNALFDKFDLKVNILKHGKQFKLYLTAASMHKFRLLFSPFFILH